MTFRDVYIGKLAEGPNPLDWGGDWNGNLPSVTSPYFPPHGAGSQAEHPFFQLTSRITDGRFPGDQVDFGGWAAKVSKTEILDFIAEVYRGDDWYTDRKSMPHLYDQFQKLLSYVRALPDDGLYALVASEF
jgi:hypothetical protein